ncbi:unnamed protein product [Mytilus coruscus]|uniref:Reverse transcriptase domain-containing protein n=1 Tax=Mytilus coruscus TaxID=42192 RepID=A0A6J8DEP7_MYTCO|nr:unnamed protein product [Mytilus coruscus]
MEENGVILGCGYERSRLKGYLQIVALCDRTGRLDIFNYFNIQEADKGKIAPLFTHFERYCRNIKFEVDTGTQVNSFPSEIFDKLSHVKLMSTLKLTSYSDDKLKVQEKEHDRRLETVLWKCEEIRLTLIPEKCQFKMREVTYIGHVLCKDEICPDPEKVKGIQDMSAPIDKTGLQRLLGILII